MSYYPTPGTPYVPQQPVNPYGGMGTVGLATPLPNTQMQQAQPQRPQPMNGQQPVQQSAQDGGWLLGRPVSSREEFLAIPSDLYGRWTYCPDLRSGLTLFVPCVSFLPCAVVAATQGPFYLV